MDTILCTTLSFFNNLRNQVDNRNINVFIKVKKVNTEVQIIMIDLLVFYGAVINIVTGTVSDFLQYLLFMKFITKIMLHQIIVNLASCRLMQFLNSLCAVYNNFLINLINNVDSN